MSHGINANIVHGWPKLARQTEAAIGAVQREFVPPAVVPAPEVQARDESIEVEVHRGSLMMKVAWSIRAAADLARLCRAG